MADRSDQLDLPGLSGIHRLDVRALQAFVPQQGRLQAILLRPARKAALVAVESCEVRPGTGLVGDHHAGKRRLRPSKRQVTAIQGEHLAVVAALTGREALEPGVLRRNLVIVGIPLLPLKELRFRVGEVLFEGTGLCHPCSRMEDALGPGGYSAMRGHGGLTLRVVEGGTLRVGDVVRRVG